MKLSESGKIKRVEGQKIVNVIIYSRENGRYMLEAEVDDEFEESVEDFLHDCGVKKEGSILLYEGILHGGVNYVIKFENVEEAEKNTPEKEREENGEREGIIDIENTPPKMPKLLNLNPKKLYVQESSEISDIIRKYQKRY